MDTLLQTVKSFIEEKYPRAGKAKTAATNLLVGGSNPEQIDKNRFAFLNQKAVKSSKDNPIINKQVLDSIPIAIKDSVSSYVKDHNNAINIYRRYLAFLKKNYGITVGEINFPPTFNSQFDRQMYIMKRLHSGKYRAEEIADELWLSTKTITDDLDELEQGITIMGQNLIIHRSDTIYSSQEINTVHPIFLSANLTQVVVLLRGLENQAQDEAYQEYAVRLAANIWCELSDYGRNRILEVSEQLNLDMDWFNLLEDKSQDDLYAKESRCSYDEGVRNVLYFLKNRKPCVIEIMSGESTEILEDCLIKAHSSSEIKVLNNGQELVIPIDSVIRASESGKYIY